MARTVNEEEHTVRRNEILDVTLRLIYTKGYERMTVQDVLDVLKISKGAFYHYFRSKQELMEGVIERMLEEAIRFLTPIVEDENLPAVEKLQRYFDDAGKWKTARKPEMLAILKVWYADENALVRHKMFAATTNRVAPFITQIVLQGVREGVFHPAYPNQVGEVFSALMQGFGDNFAKAFIEPDPSVLPQVMETVASFTDAMERILGAPAGSLKLVDEQILKEWLEPQVEKGTHRES